MDDPRDVRHDMTPDQYQAWLEGNDPMYRRFVEEVEMQEQAQQIKLEADLNARARIVAGLLMLALIVAVILLYRG